jgi:hypothetical protein
VVSPYSPLGSCNQKPSSSSRHWARAVASPPPRPTGSTGGSAIGTDGTVVVVVVVLVDVVVLVVVEVVDVVLDVVVGATVVVDVELVVVVLGSGVLAIDVVAQAARRAAPPANTIHLPRTRMMVVNPTEQAHARSAIALRFDG